MNQCTPSSTRVAATADGDRRGGADQCGLHRVGSAAAHQQRERGERRRGSGGVAGRERRAGEAGELVDRRPGAIDEPLDEVGDGELAEHDDASGSRTRRGERMRRYSTAPMTAATATTPARAAEQADRPAQLDVDASVAWRAPNSAKRRSSRANPALLRIISSSTPTAGAPITTAVATVTRITPSSARRRPGSGRSRASRGCLAQSPRDPRRAEVRRAEQRPPADGAADHDPARTGAEHGGEDQRGVRRGSRSASKRVTEGLPTCAAPSNHRPARNHDRCYDVRSVCCAGPVCGDAATGRREGTTCPVEHRSNPTGQLVAEHPRARQARAGRMGGQGCRVHARRASWRPPSSSRRSVGRPESTQEASPTGAIKTIAGSPGGTLLLWMLGVAMLLYAAWRVASRCHARRARRRVDGQADRLRRQRRDLHHVRHHGDRARPRTRPPPIANAEDGNAKVTNLTGPADEPRRWPAARSAPIGVIVIGAGDLPPREGAARRTSTTSSISRACRRSGSGGRADSAPSARSAVASRSA